MVEYEIITTSHRIKFVGRYRRDLESENWHYYEVDDGSILHFHKKYMIYVKGDNADGIIKHQKK